MSVYFLAQIKVIDKKEYSKYLEKCDIIFSRYNGKYLAVDSTPVLLEGSWNYTRTVIIEFPVIEDFYSWYNSDEYQDILKNRLNGAICDSVLIHGN